MSTWRDIWRESVRANRIMALDEVAGQEEFAYLFKENGDDGMLHFAVAEAWEYRGNYQGAVEEYSKAVKLFPAPHWKEVARKNIDRIQKQMPADEYFNKNDFELMSWLAFHKVYGYVHLSDFVRYISLSALSRANSEWPLALIDFRTVLEILIKTTFPEVEKYLEEENGEFNLKESIDELKRNPDLPLFDSNLCSCMHQIRRGGNTGTHDPENMTERDTASIQNLITVLECFDTYKKEHPRHQ